MRFRVIGGKYVQKYQPTKVTQFKSDVKEFVKLYLPAWWKPIETGALEVTFRYTFPYTKTMLQKRQFPVYKTTKPDIDNCGKALQDALTGILWKDDNIIAIRHSSKTYGAEPKIFVLVERL
jgi:Holliday junction resolvase RusA-like endonuclease